jgi:SulP family sulfate permease
VGATLIEVLDDYAEDLAEVGGRLYLSGVDERVAAQLRSTRKLDLERGVHIVLADAVLGASTARAGTLARAWLGSTPLNAPEAQDGRGDGS